MQSETKQDGCLKALVQTRSRHHQTWRFESCVCKSRNGGWNIPSHYNGHNKSTITERPRLKLYYKQNAKTPKKDIHSQLIEDKKVLCKKWQTNHSNNSTAQGSQLISPLLSAPWPLMSQKVNEIHDVMERYAQYYLAICQILQILPNK